MKKNIIRIIGITLVIIILYYIVIVSLNNFCLLIPSKQVINSELKFVIKDNKISREEATLLLENNTDILWTYHPKSVLEKNVNGIWYTIVPKHAKNYLLPMIKISQGEVKELYYNFTEEYGSLTQGKYRIQIEVEKILDENDLSSQKLKSVAEFEIK